MIFGIDLGTTKSVVGIFKDGEIRIIPDRHGNRSIPSLVLVSHDGSIYAGSSAAKHPERYKGKNITISSIKRMIGKKGETGWGWWKTYPQEVSAFILSELKEQVKNETGQDVDRAVIAIPAHFDINQRRATKEAAEIAGIEVIRLLNESTAAGIAYGYQRRDEEEKILIFDFGGGTLDISILEMGGGVFVVKNIVGDDKLGGDDFDQILFNYILERTSQDFKCKFKLDKFHSMVLMEAVEKAKIELSSRAETNIYIPKFFYFRGNYQDLHAKIERKVFEKLSEKLLNRSLDLLKRAMNEARIEASSLSKVIIIGGSGRIPYIRERIKKELGLEPHTGIDPITCVAEGAIIYGASIEGNLKDIVLLDILPNSYGTGLKGGILSKVIEKGTAIPTSKSMIFTTSEDNQSQVDVSIYQGDEVFTSKDIFLGIIQLKDIPPAPASVPKIELTFDVDSNMIVHISAKDLGTGKQQEMVAKSLYGLNPTQIKVMRKKLNVWRSSLGLLQIKSNIQYIISSIDNILSSAGVIAIENEEISVLKAKKTFLKKLLTKKVIGREMEWEIISIQQIIEKFRQKTDNCEEIINKSKILLERIDSFNLIIKSYREKDSKILEQGKEILIDYLQRNVAYSELEKMFSSVYQYYENIKIDMIIETMEDLATLDPMKECFRNIESRIRNPLLINQDLSRLRKMKEVSSTIYLLKNEYVEFENSILKKIVNKIRGDNYKLVYFFLIISSFLDYKISLVIDEIRGEEKLTDIIAILLLNGMNFEKNINKREEFARLAAEILPPTQNFIHVFTDFFVREDNEKIKFHLLDYIKRLPPGEFCKFFFNADIGMQNEIRKNKDLLLKLLNEPEEKSQIFALEFFAKLPWKESINILISQLDNKSFRIRLKTLKLLVYSYAMDRRMEKICREALRDPFSEIRLIALKFVEKQKDISFVPDLFNLIKFEREKIVLEKTINIISSFRDYSNIVYFLELLLDENRKIRISALSCINKNMNLYDELFDKDIKKLIDLIKKVYEKKQSLGFLDNAFLWRIQKRHPEVRHIVQILKEFKN